MLDKPMVRQIYDRLARLGAVDPWLDEKNLTPGDDWDFEIRKAVRSSHVVLVCLTARSITKEGYVHREIRQALDVADEKPEGTIFIVPVRLEPCQVPERLSRWQWVDWFSGDGFEQLQRALRKRAAALGIPILTAAGRLLYDSRNERLPFEPWTWYSKTGGFGGIRAASSGDVANYCIIESFGGESVGINRSFNVLAGTFEFDYSSVSGDPFVQNLVVYVIPMQETGFARSGLIEVGTDVQDDPSNPKSAFRAKFVIPAQHVVDHTWHQGRLDFDFRTVPTAFYSIFGPRVNEGCDKVGPAALAIANIRLYVFS